MYTDMVQMTVASIVANIQKTPKLRALTLELGDQIVLIFIDPELISEVLQSTEYYANMQ